MPAVDKCPGIMSAVLLALLTLGLPGVAAAQDDEGGMTFGVDEVEEEAEGGEDDGGMSFGVDEAEADPDDLETAEEQQSMAVVAVPTSAVSEEQRHLLQTRLAESMQRVRGYSFEGRDAILTSLRDRGAERCARESLCLATIGDNPGVNNLVLARITQVGERYRLDLDLFDVDERLFATYESVEDLASVGDAIDEIDGAVSSVFELRERDGGPEVDSGKSRKWVQPTFAISSAVLSAGFIAGGIAFGLQANNERQEIVDRRDAGEVTQRQAQSDLENAESTAARANAFYGIGAGLAVVSVVLFTVDFGSDVATEEELEASRVRDFRIAPSVTPERAGIGAFFRF